MSDEKAVDLVLRAKNEVSQGADAASDSLGQLAQEAQQLDAEFKQLEAAGAIGQEFEELRDAVSNLNAELSSAKAVQQNIDNFKQLKTATVEAEKEWQSATDRVKELAKEMAASENPSKAMERDFARAKKAAASSKDAFEEKRQSLQQLRTELGKSGVNTKDLGAAQQQLTTHTKELGSSLKNARSDLAATSAAAKQANSNFSALQAQLKPLAAAMAGLFAANQIKGYATDMIDVADSYGQMASRLEQVTSGTAEYEMVQARLLDTARGTYRPLEEAQEMFIRTADSLRDMGYQTEQVLDITDSFSYGLVANAADAQRAQSALDSYSKALQTGKVEVDGWVSLMTAMPSIVNQLAEVTGKTAAEIRELGATGKLSIDDLNKTLYETRDANQAIADSMPTTVADAAQSLKNAWSAYIGEANRASGSTEKLAGYIEMVADNLDEIVKVATAVGEIAIAFTAAKAAVTLLTLSVGLYTKATAAATGATWSLNAAIRANPIGLVTTLLGSAISALLLFRDTSKESADSVTQLSESNEELIKTLKSLGEEEAASKLTELAEQEKQAVADIKAARASLQAMLDEGFITPPNSPLNKSLEDAERRLRNAQFEAGLLRDRMRELEKSTDSVAEATEKSADQQERLNELLKGTGTTLEELETGISEHERKMLDAFSEINREGLLTGQAMDAYADRIAKSLKSEAARSALAEIGEAGAAAIQRASEAADAAAARANGRINQLSQALGNLLNEGQKANFDLYEAAQAAKNRDDIETVEAALRNVREENKRAAEEGRKSRYAEVDLYRIETELNRARAAENKKVREEWERRNQVAQEGLNISREEQQATQQGAKANQQLTQTVDDQTWSFDRLHQSIADLPKNPEINIRLSPEPDELQKQFQGLVKSIPDETIKTLLLELGTTTEEVQAQVDQVLAGVDARLKLTVYVDQNELAALTSSIRQAVQQAAGSLARDLQSAIRRAGG